MNEEILVKFAEYAKEIQNYIYDNKKKKWFNIDNVPLEFCYLSWEVAEAFDAWRKNKDDLGEEISDVVIYCFGLASILWIDLWNEISSKMKKNLNRNYIKTDHWLEKIKDVL